MLAKDLYAKVNDPLKEGPMSTHNNIPYSNILDNTRVNEDALFSVSSENTLQSAEEKGGVSYNRLYLSRGVILVRRSMEEYRLILPKTGEVRASLKRILFLPLRVKGGTKEKLTTLQQLF